MSAPYIIFPLLAIVAIAVWWLRGWQIKIFEARLQLADQRAAWAKEAKDEIERQFNAFKVEVAAKSGNGGDAATAAKVEAAIDKLDAILSASRGDRADFRGTVE